MNEKARLAKTDSTAREELVTSFEPLIKKTVRQYVRDYGLYNDALQEGCLAVLNCIRLYNPDAGSNFAAYVKVSVTHNIIHFVKGQKNELSLDDECDSTEGLTFLDMLPSDIDIEAEEISKLEMDCFCEAFPKLSADQRLLLYNLYYKRRTIGSISEEQGCHYNTVVKRREKALSALRDLLKDIL